MPCKLMTTKDLANYLGLTTKTLERWRERRIGPAWVPIGNKVRYRHEDIDAWLSRNRHGPVLQSREG